MSRFVLVVLLLLAALAGTADAAPIMPADLRVAGALFTPARTEDGIDWHSHWVLTPESAAELESGAKRTLRFALPLAEGETVQAASGVVPFVEGGRVAGIIVDRTALDGRTLSAVVRQRVAVDGAGLHLGAPVAAGTALQIVDGDLGAGTRFEIATGGVFERSVGYVAAPGISHSAREEARRLTGYGSRVTGAALYVRGDDMRAGNGIAAIVVTPRTRARHGTMAIAVLFAVIVAGLFAAVRRLRHSASLERADALLAAELDTLEAQHGRRGS